MEIAFTKALAALVLPPGLQVLAGAAGLALLAAGRRRPGVVLLAAGVASLYLVSLPPVARGLALAVQAYPALVRPVEAARGAGAIVVLGGGRVGAAPEYGGRDTVSASALVRLRYAAWLHRRTGLPLLVTGGSVFGEPVPEADLMADVLEHELGVPVRWRERESRNTAENATGSARVLRGAGVDRVLLVTHAVHMRRAVRAFERAGLAVVAAPTAVATGAAGPDEWRDLLPHAWALRASERALHEVVGLAWYRLRALLGATSAPPALTRPGAEVAR